MFKVLKVFLPLEQVILIASFFVVRFFSWKKPASGNYCPAEAKEDRFINLQLFANGKSESGEDKTEEPTPHRLREARKRGQVMKSMEMNAAVSMLGMTLLFVIFWRHFMTGLTDMLGHYLSIIPGFVIDEASFYHLSRFTLEQYLFLAAPFLLTALVLGVISNVLQVGFLVSSEVMKPQANRINPVEGFKRVFSRRALFEMVKSILKVTIIGAVSYTYLRSQLTEMLLLLGQEAGVVASVMGQVLMGLAFRVAAVFFFLALLDFIYQRYEFKQKMRMTRKEVKDEHKQLEGDPQLRARLREKQKAIVQQRSLEKVPEATVVITNPTELAVALRYDEREDHAPMVIAKGAAVLAERIRDIAAENNIPVIQNPPVAQVLYEQAEPGEEIPVELYQVVAEILAMVYRLQEKEKQRRHRV